MAVRVSLRGRQTAAALLLMLCGRAAPAAAVDLDLDAIFRCKGLPAAGAKSCGAAREMILTNCTACHTFAPIVMQQFDEGGWQGLLDRHRPRVPQFTDADIRTLRTYLTASFNPDRDPPELPEELMKTWTAY